jgi:hypothetical protein
MQSIIDFLWNNWAVIATALFAVSEVLASIPAVKSNSVFQFLFGWLKTQTGK